MVVGSAAAVAERGPVLSTRGPRVQGLVQGLRFARLRAQGLGHLTPKKKQ